MKKIFLIGLLVLVATANPSFATPISGTGSWGAFSGTFSFTAANIDGNGHGGTVTVTLVNESPTSNGGYITGLAFNIPDEFTVAGYSYSAPASFEYLKSPVNAASYGTYDIGSALGGDFLGGGGPNEGIAVGGSGTFSFSFFEDFTEQEFITQADDWFLVRFKGFNNGQSDKVPIGNPVPEPTTMLLLVVGLIGLGFFGRKKSLK